MTTTTKRPRRSLRLFGTTVTSSSSTPLLLSLLLTTTISLLLSSSLLLVDGHVMLVDPPPRIQDDYLYSIGGDDSDENGVCAITTCDSFCGHPANDPNSPTTRLQVGKPINIKWVTNVPHAPYRYRISFNPRPGDGGVDGHFDLPENQLTPPVPGGVANADAADQGNIGFVGSFTTSVTIPESFLENCTNPIQPCALHLWDYYYFVSCANVVLVSSSTTEEEEGQGEVNDMDEEEDDDELEHDEDDSEEEEETDNVNGTTQNSTIALNNATDLVVDDGQFPDDDEDNQDEVEAEEEMEVEEETTTTTTSKSGLQMLRG